jgi:DNA-binding IclR family transcriptional regulator
MRRLALPHLQALVEWTSETANLQVVVGDQVRFVATVVCSQVLRVGDREGRLLPAHLASGGRAVLATRSDEEVAELYSARDSPVPVPDLPALLRELRRIRRQGFAVNDQATEAGVTAIGRAVRGPGSRAVAAVSLAIPTARFSRDRLAEWTGHLATTVAGIEHGLGPA